MNPQREPLPTRVDQTADLPAAYHAALASALTELDLDLGPQARAVIDGHVRMLLAWTPFINLTSIRDPAAVALAHVADSLTAVSVLREHGVDRFLDLGSGGGLPGIPLAAALPASRVCLVEPIGKKARFLEAVVHATGSATTIRVTHGRGEALAVNPDHRAAWPAVTARAVSSTADLIELAFPLLEPGGILVAWKRGDLTHELTAARRAATGLGGGEIQQRPIAVTGLPGHVLLTVRRTGRIPDGYPRDPAERRRRPW